MSRAQAAKQAPGKAAGQAAPHRRPAWLSGWAGRLADRLIAADPAYSRLRLATRAMLSLTLTGLVLAAVTLVAQPPFAAYGLGVVVSFIGAVAVRDADRRGQALTRAAVAATAAVSATLAGALSPLPLVADLAFLAVIFLSVYIRRYGARTFAAGMAGFMAYFIGDYLHPDPRQAGWLLFAAALAGLSTQLVTILWLPPDPERHFRRAMHTIDHRINLILRHLLDAARRGALPPGDDEAVRRQLAQLRDIVLMAEGFVPQISEETWAVSGAAGELATALFDLQLAVERLARHRRVALPPPEALAALLADEGPGLRLDRPHAPPGDGAAGVPLSLLAQLRDSRARINAVLDQRPSPAFARPAPSGQDKTAGKTAGGGGDGPLIPATLHRPIQVTLACGIAIAVGGLISPSMWFWAVITAYLVFNNTKTRADTGLRALQRGGGTLAGVIAGTLLATYLHDMPVVSGALLPVAFFLAFYFLQASYGVMVFFLTIGIALIYGLIGVFTPERLMLRLVETVVGGLAGAGAAFLVFPVRTTPDAVAGLTALLDAMEGMLDAALARVCRDGSAAEVIAATRRLERRYAQTAAAARPLGGPWTAVTRFGQIREKLLILATCLYWARQLARALQDAPRLTAAEQAQFLDLAASLRGRIGQMRDGAGQWFARARVTRPVALPAGTAAPGCEATAALARLDQLLEAALAAPRGAG